MEFYKNVAFEKYSKESLEELKVNLKAQLNAIKEPFTEVWVCDRYIPIIAKKYNFEQVTSDLARIDFICKLIDKSVDKASFGLLIDVNVWWHEHGVSFCFEGETILIKTQSNEKVGN